MQLNLSPLSKQLRSSRVNVEWHTCLSEQGPMGPRFLPEGPYISPEGWILFLNGVKYAVTSWNTQFALQVF